MKLTFWSATEKAAGIYLHARLNDSIQHGQPLYTLHAESKGELN